MLNHITIMVTTNSDASICPICRFPISRITAMSIKYNTIVRKYDIIIFPPPYLGFPIEEKICILCDKL